MYRDNNPFWIVKIVRCNVTMYCNHACKQWSSFGTVGTCSTVNGRRLLLL